MSAVADKSFALGERIAEIFARHDPLRLCTAQSRDEYAPRALHLLPALERAHTQEDVLVLIHQEFSRRFGAVLTGPTARYRDIAREVWAALRADGAPNF